MKPSILDVTEHHYSSGHIEYRLWGDVGYSVLTEKEYLEILYSKDLEDAKNESDLNALESQTYGG